MSVAKRLAATRSQSRPGPGARPGGGKPTSLSVTVTGADELAETLEALADDQDRRGLLAALDEAVGQWCEQRGLPAVLAEVPRDTGALAEAIDVRRITRKDGRVAHAIGTHEPLYQGDLWYGALQEFGWRHGKRPSRSKASSALDTRHEVQTEGYLRSTLYRLEPELERHVEQSLRDWVKRTNRL